MKQMNLSGGGVEKYGKTTRRAQFLAEMDRVVPWAELCAVVEPYYPKGKLHETLPKLRQVRSPGAG